MYELVTTPFPLSLKGRTLLVVISLKETDFLIVVSKLEESCVNRGCFLEETLAGAGGVGVFTGDDRFFNNWSVGVMVDWVSGFLWTIYKSSQLIDLAGGLNTELIDLDRGFRAALRRFFVILRTNFLHKLLFAPSFSDDLDSILSEDGVCVSVDSFKSSPGRGSMRL